MPASHRSSRSAKKNTLARVISRTIPFAQPPLLSRVSPNPCKTNQMTLLAGNFAFGTECAL